MKNHLIIFGNETKEVADIYGHESHHRLALSPLQLFQFSDTLQIQSLNLSGKVMGNRSHPFKLGGAQVGIDAFKVQIILLLQRVFKDIGRKTLQQVTAQPQPADSINGTKTEQVTFLLVAIRT